MNNGGSGPNNQEPGGNNSLPPNGESSSTGATPSLWGALASGLASGNQDQLNSHILSQLILGRQQAPNLNHAATQLILNQLRLQAIQPGQLHPQQNAQANSTDQSQQGQTLSQHNQKTPQAPDAPTAKRKLASKRENPSESDNTTDSEPGKRRRSDKSKHMTTLIIPCRARSMPADHNSNVRAYA